MVILSVETSTMTGSVALLETSNDAVQVLGETTLSVSAVHSEKIMPAIETLLENAKLTLNDVDLFAGAHGPGSFTGLRIGLATVQGLSLSMAKPMIGVSSLKSLAVNGAFYNGMIVPMFDARRGEIYVGVYKNSSLSRVVDEKAISPEKFLSEIEGGLFLGSGAETYRELIIEKLGERASFAPASLNIPRASHVGVLAFERWKEESKAGTTHLEPLRPQYIRPAAVTFPQKAS